MSRNSFIIAFLLRNGKKLKTACPKDLHKKLWYQVHIAKHAWKHYLKSK